MSRIAFVTTCKGRLAHLTATLPKNIADCGQHDAVFIVLDYNDNEGLGDYIWHHHKRDMQEGRLVYYRTTEPERFHMAHAKNMAHRCAMREGADILVTLDADNLTGPGFSSYIRYEFNTHPGLSFVCPDFDTLPPRGFRFNKDNPTRLGRGFAGRIAIRAQDFLKVGGYDEMFDTWRGEDIDLIARLDRLGLKKRAMEPDYLHALTHGSELRFREYPHAVQYENDAIYEITATGKQTIVNFGRIGCGTVYRNFRDQPIKLGPVPTRVFGVGMQRTGTTSLHVSFQLLGYDSAHWPSASWSQAVWQECNRWERSATLEQSYAACDNPIPLLYQKLDVAYPGSKFVLTVRDEADWIRSVERFWTYEGNKHRWTWDMDGFTHKMHSMIYGRPTFNRRAMLAAYRRHNEGVQEYFAGRPNDLLVLNMNGHVPFAPLCEFLGAPAPRDAALPHRNRSR